MGGVSGGRPFQLRADALALSTVPILRDRPKEAPGCLGSDPPKKKHVAGWNDGGRSVSSQPACEPVSRAWIGKPCVTSYRTHLGATHGQAVPVLHSDPRIADHTLIAPWGLGGTRPPRYLRPLPKPKRR